VKRRGTHECRAFISVVRYIELLPTPRAATVLAELGVVVRAGQHDGCVLHVGVVAAARAVSVDQRRPDRAALARPVIMDDNTSCLL